GEGLSPPAHRAQETGEGVTDRLLIIDNRDQRGLGHAYLPGLVCVLLRPMPSSGKSTTRCGKPILYVGIGILTPWWEGARVFPPCGPALRRRWPASCA